jgi:hypothetical protein
MAEILAHALSRIRSAHKFISNYLCHCQPHDLAVEGEAHILKYKINICVLFTNHYFIINTIILYIVILI